MKILTSILIIGGLVLGVTPLFAATYKYVDVNGEAQIENAKNPSEALQTAPNIAPNSGVMEVKKDEAILMSIIDPDTEVYGYINTQGNIDIQVAENPYEAMELAPNIMSNSGVMLLIE